MERREIKLLLDKKIEYKKEPFRMICMLKGFFVPFSAKTVHFLQGLLHTKKMNLYLDMESAE